jgi:hypothetical protein
MDNPSVATNTEDETINVNTLYDIYTNAPHLVVASLNEKVRWSGTEISPFYIKWIEVLCPYSEAIAKQCITQAKHGIEDARVQLVDSVVRRGRFAFGVREMTEAEELVMKLSENLKPREGKCLCFRHATEIGHEQFKNVEKKLDDVGETDERLDVTGPVFRILLAKYHIAVRVHNNLHRHHSACENPSYYPRLAVLKKDTVDWLLEGLDGASRLLLDDHLKWRINAESLRGYTPAGVRGGYYDYQGPILDILNVSKRVASLAERQIYF